MDIKGKSETNSNINHIFSGTRWPGIQLIPILE